MIGIAMFRCELETGNGCNRRQSFTAKAERVNCKEIVGGAYFACRMTLKGEDRVRSGHPTPIVRHRNPLFAPFVQHDRYQSGAGIDCVLDQLLDGGCGPLDNLTRGDPICGNFIKQDYLIFRHGASLDSPTNYS